MLCVTAFAGVGYAALTSTVSNSDNVVGSSFAILKITDEDGDTDITISGDAVIDYGTVTTETGTSFFVENEDVAIGRGILEVDASNYKGDNAQLSYKVLVYDPADNVKDYVASPVGVLKYIVGFELEIKDGEAPLTLNDDRIQKAIESEKEYEFEFVLKAIFDDQYTSGSIEDGDPFPLGEVKPELSFKYKIVFTLHTDGS